MVLLRKAQIETVGLVIIVIILAFTLIFALQFINKDKGNKLNENYLKLNADNLRSTILKTTINNCDIKDEIINCNNFNQAICLENCDRLNSIIREIIQASVKNNYEFDAGNIKLVNGSCLDKDIITSSIQPLALTDIKIVLKLC
ncbi:MAG: hypothetical protein AABX45_02160 [Nanoarchaeota archaeon]